MKKYTINEITERLKQVGLDIAIIKFNNTSKPIHFLCNKCGSIFNAFIYNLVKRKSGCPKCNSYQKYKYDDIIKIISQKNGILVSSREEYKNTHSIISIICNECKTQWEPKVYSVICSDRWCPKCAGNLKYTMDNVKKVIDSIGAKLLSIEYKNTSQKLDASCNKCNTLWHPTFKEIINGTGCPKCALGKSQRKLFDILSKIYSNKQCFINYKEFSWLKGNKNSKMEIDIFIKDSDGFALAIEYDGRQHFEPIDFGNKGFKESLAELHRTKDRDLRKNQLIKDHPDDVKFFIRFCYKDILDYNSVINKLYDNGIPT